MLAGDHAKKLTQRMRDVSFIDMLTQFLRRFFLVKPPILGRWCLHDTSSRSWKIDMANIDHCGTCAQTATATPIATEKKIKT